MNAEQEMATADGLGPQRATDAERLKRLRELIDGEEPIDGVHNGDVEALYDAADPSELECQGHPDEGASAGETSYCDGTCKDVPACPRFLACTSEGTGESSYRDNPDYFAGDREAVGEWIAGSYGEGWACNWVVDLDTGKEVGWTTTASVEGADDFDKALADFKRATAALVRAWQPGDEDAGTDPTVNNYPPYLPSFDELALDLQAIERAS